MLMRTVYVSSSIRQGEAAINAPCSRGERGLAQVAEPVSPAAQARGGASKLWVAGPGLADPPLPEGPRRGRLGNSAEDEGTGPRATVRGRRLGRIFLVIERHGQGESTGKAAAIGTARCG